MGPKYTRGQKVTIRSVKNQHYQSKYPEIEQYVNQAGTIAESYQIRASQGNRAGATVPQPSDDYIYRVHLDKQNRLVTVSEEALEPLGSED
jgi:hypothetical protein